MNCCRLVRLCTLSSVITLCVAISSCGVNGPLHFGPPPPAGGSPEWAGFARDAQHSALSNVGTQPLARVHWETPVDLSPPYVGSELLVHYGSVVITQSNTVIVPFHSGAGGLQVHALNGTGGALMWQASSDYVFPPHNWVPSFNVTLTPSDRLYFPGSGGKVFYRDNADAVAGTVNTAVFYGQAVYNANKPAYDADVFIDTPITSDAQGDIFFGFIATGLANLTSGIARIGSNGVGCWVGASTAAGDAGITHVEMNSAPAISSDQQTVYVTVSGAYYSNLGYLLALDATTLHTKGKVQLIDPSTGQGATITDDATASPMVGPDGDVYLGVLETSVPAHNDRGWLLHFNATLSQAKIPGSFGWDDTPSVVPASMVPSYAGPSSYLLMSKYNNYAGLGTGDGHNRIAILDPNATQADSVSGIPVMKEIETILGMTPDINNPGGVREWCINTAAVDPVTKSVLANSEDGYLYRWDLTTNSFTQRIALTSGIGEAYTPTAVGPDGQVYAVNNAVLFAVGQ